MTALAPAHAWWTPAEIAAAGLPDLPATRQGVDALIERDGWRAQPGMAQRRSGKGGGWEYSWRLFPSRAQRKLLQAVARLDSAEKPTRDAQWAWFEGLPEAVKAKARARLAILQAVEALEAAAGRHTAVTSVAASSNIGARTIWSWIAMVEGVRPDDRLAWLAPRNRAGEKRPRAKDCDPAFFDFLKADYLRPEAPPFSDCYRRAMRVAPGKGWDTLPERTMRRRLDAEVSETTQVLARKGVEAHRRLYPAQVRDKTAMTAMEAVNADFHKFDVFVRWPALRGEEAEIVRPQMVAFQDIHSGRILSWRLDVTPNATAVQLAAGDMVETWGIPEHVLFDNGREFAAKAITGGASTRFRFKAKVEDIPGLFTTLGCKIHWATPYRGQSKPIERAFRDMCSAIAKDPRFAGAYTGNRPDAKPENYRSKAIPLEVFLKVLAEGIEEHNTRVGRRSEVAFGRSFAEVFAESYATAPIRKATEVQRRLWLLGAEGLRADSKTGQIRFKDSTFWEPWCHEIAGKRVVVRFDPANLHSGVHVYAQDGAYLGHAIALVKGAFFDMDDARTHARAVSAWIAAEKKALAAHRRMTAAEVGTALDAIAPVEVAALEAKVVRAVFGKSAGGAESAGASAGAVVTDLAARRGGAPEVAAPAADDTSPRGLFRRALDLERAIDRGEILTVDQARWLTSFQKTQDYRFERMAWEDLGGEAGGDAIFG
jgi:putative transposase